MATQTSYIGHGKIFIGPYGGGGALREVGQASDFKLTINADVKELRDMQGDGGLADVYPIIKDVEAEITLESYSTENLNLAFYGTESSNTATQQTVTMAGYKGGLIPTGVAGQLNSVTVHVGTDTLTLLQDYTVEQAGIYIVETPNYSHWTDGNTVTIVGTPPASTLIQGAVVPANEFTIIGSLTNKANSDKGVVVKLNRCRMDPAKNIEFLSDDFAKMQITAMVLKDQTIIDDTKSQYFTITNEA